MGGLVFYGATGKFTWRMLATVLAGQSVVIFFGALVARALAASSGDDTRSGTYLVLGSALALLCVVAAGMLRRPWGVTLGWLVLLFTIASALVLPMMLAIGLIFLALWVTCLVLGHRIDAEQAAQAEAGTGDPRTAGTATGDPRTAGTATGDRTTGERGGDTGTDRVTG